MSSQYGLNTCIYTIILIKTFCLIWRICQKKGISPNFQISLAGHYLPCQIVSHTLGKVEDWAITEKKTNTRLGTYLFDPPVPLEILSFFTLPLGIPGTTKLHPQKLHKILLHPQEILRPKTKTPGNSSIAISSIPLGIPYPQALLLVFFF